MPWLRIVWELWWFRILTNDAGSYYIKWIGRPGLKRLRGKRED